MPLVSNKPRVIALGTFDGLHPGHRRVIEMCIARARELDARALIYTFWENPKSLFGSEPLEIMSASEKLTRMLEMGADEVAADHFTKALSELSPGEFVEMLIRRFKPLCFVCGEDYSFGRRGAGAVQTLKALSEAHGIDVCVAPTVNILTHDGYLEKKVSSTEIRGALIRGENELAQKLLRGDAI